MKDKLKELEVDIIGEQDRPLTKEEEEAISDFIRADKEKQKIKAAKKLKPKQKQLSK